MDLIPIERHAPGSFPGLYPDAGHLGFDLAMPIQAHAPTWTVAQVLGTGHRAGHAGAVQDTLPTHLAVKDGALAEPFDLDKEPVPWRAWCQPALEGFQGGKGGVVKTL